jgi:hypothetical protein
MRALSHLGPMILALLIADAGNARQQAERGAYDPAYLNYTRASS